MVFYPAYAYRHFVTTDDLMLDRPFYVYEEAAEYADSWLCDDDDCGVFTIIGGEWYAVHDRDQETGKLRVNKGHMRDARNTFLV